MNRDRLHVGIDAFRLVGPPTSIGTYTDELIAALLKQGYEITLYAPRAEGGAALNRYQSAGSPCRVVCLEKPLKPETSPRDLFVWNQRALPQLMRQHPCQAFIAPYHQTPCLTPDGIPTIAVIHDLCGLRRDCGYRYGGRAWFRHLWNLFSAAMFAKRIIPISVMTRSDMLRKFTFCHKRLSQPIYNQVSGTTLDAAEAEKHLAPYRVPKRFVLVFGLLSPRKGLDVAIKGYLEYRISGGDASLVMIGVQDEQALRTRFPASFAADIVMLPRVSACERDALYRLASCLLFCSRCEGFGYPVVEAMRQGCPVVASKSTPAAEITAGLIELMDTPNPQQCAALIKRYTTLTENDRQALAERLIRRSADFSNKDFGAAFDREIRAALR
jgi:glycosyltransferase involved in cell wall biosynthesis